jgi:hypothetical protein
MCEPIMRNYKAKYVPENKAGWHTPTIRLTASATLLACATKSLNSGLFCRSANVAHGDKLLPPEPEYRLKF